jgi:hypothetical protein
MLGRLKTIQMTVDNGDVTLALTNVVGQSSGTGATFNDAGDALVLIGGASGKWIVVKEYGITLHKERLMSLDFSKLAPPYSTRVWRIIGMCAVGIGILVIMWVAVDGISRWMANRGITKAQNDVNAAKQDLANITSNANVDKALANQAVANLQTAVNARLDAANASEAARTQTNAALANVGRAVNANLPVNTAANDLDRKLDNLGIQ